MTSEIRARLILLLHEELPESEAVVLRQRLRDEPELAHEYRELEELWTGLELPEPKPAPSGSAERVSLAALRWREDRVSWSMAPGWAQAAAAFALAGGIVLGLGLASVVELSEDSTSFATDPTLAESYWQILDEVEDESLMDRVFLKEVSLEEVSLEEVSP